ncbi:hypothetical protein [Salinimicrobium sediminis]|uniref:hypothetical protein n=1 Tax=Salinimicrobium sediminis TaxID=1343891 RepID=UPI001C540D4D|nr:hypothetical protein [Salinimicrobium sediminis]
MNTFPAEVILFNLLQHLFSFGYCGSPFTVIEGDGKELLQVFRFDFPEKECFRSYFGYRV